VGLVDQILRQCSKGKALKASTSALAWFIMSVTFGNCEEKVSATRSQAELTSVGSGFTNTVRSAAATISAEAFGTLASTLRVKWTLGRRRPKVHYAEVRVMPTWTEVPLWELGFVAVRSA
jgi:hypothetical protein